MNEANTISEPVPRPRRGWPLVAWIVILAVVGVILWRNYQPSGEGEAKAGWLVPMLTALCLFVALIALAQSSAIAPFVYTLF